MEELPTKGRLLSVVRRHEFACLDRNLVALTMRRDTNPHHTGQMNTLRRKKTKRQHRMGNSSII